MAEESLLGGELKLVGRLDARFFALLEAIEATGSINKAARTAGYSYKGAWLLLETAAGLAQEPLMQRATGGRGGGGSRLTPTAKAMIAAWHELQRRHRAFLRTQDDWLVQQPALAGMFRRLAMKTSARNQFAGTINRVDAGPVSTQVRVALRGGSELHATLSTTSAERLQLRKGVEAIALVKASEVMLVTDAEDHRLSARNQLAGVVSRVQKGAVTSLVALTLPGGSVVTASVTNDAVASMRLAAGVPAMAVFKGYAVMLAVATAH